jgi:hypothetical protein
MVTTSETDGMQIWIIAPSSVQWIFGYSKTDPSQQILMRFSMETA